MLTTDTAAGYVVERSIGMVWGEEHSRGRTVEAMTQSAALLGGNGVLGVRWALADTGASEARLFFAYGTAVVLRPADHPARPRP